METIVGIHIPVGLIIFSLLFTANIICLIKEIRRHERTTATVITLAIMSIVAIVHFTIGIPQILPFSLDVDIFF